MLGVKAGKDSLPFAIFVTQYKEEMNLRGCFGTLCSRLGVEFQCPHCHSNNIIRSGKSSTGKQRYRCKNCRKRFITDYNIQSLSS
ncbi:IS1 family transposase [Prevotella histicola]|uniref:IS1/IS1595 family N-terminal zinc-binding domain-containing protein n=2 Tax=Prevotella histicola TaxID=470565 RepID=UPI0036F283E7